MDRTQEVNEIKGMANDFVSYATCTLQEFDGSAENYVDAIVEMCNPQLDEHDLNLLKKFMLEQV